MSFRVQLINMGTRAAACKYFSWSSDVFSMFQKWRRGKSLHKLFIKRFFIYLRINDFITLNLPLYHQFSVQAKLRCLHDYHLRLLHNSVPLPSGVDIANTIKYFSQTLLSEYWDFHLAMECFTICCISLINSCPKGCSQFSFRHD